MVCFKRAVLRAQAGCFVFLLSAQRRWRQVHGSTAFRPNRFPRKPGESELEVALVWCDRDGYRTRVGGAIAHENEAHDARADVEDP